MKLKTILETAGKVLLLVALMLMVTLSCILILVYPGVGVLLILWTVLNNSDRLGRISLKLHRIESKVEK